MEFSSDSLYRQLNRHPVPPQYWVAYSGGLDSHVLLHALAALRSQPGCVAGAVHVNHGLQHAAARMEAHCRSVCAALGLELVILQVDARAGSGDSPEAAARTARYRELAGWLPAGHCLLTAQHRDDQAETLLLQLLRGSGVGGLAAMPESAPFGAGRLLRPLLNYTRQALHAYADSQQLTWIEDPSNTDTAFDRNYLRREVMPALRRRWPSATAVLARSAGHCAEAAAVMDQLGAEDLQVLAGRAPGTLSLSGLAVLPVVRQRNALRYWIKAATGTAPSTAILARILSDVLASRPDAEPCIRWGGYEIRRYRDDIYLLEQRIEPRRERVLNWTLGAPLALPDAGGILSVQPEPGRGIRAEMLARSGVHVRYRQGGERCRPVGRGHHHSLKKLFQEEGIPPWERALIPLIYVEDQLAMVPGFWVCEPFQARPAETGLLISWSGAGKSPQ
ncbi:MAG: tRNA lysidine(34) synthetase TilS, partial [Gammaproteobacteria bacterium]